MDKKDVDIVEYKGYFSDKSLIRTNFNFDYKIKSYEKMIEEISKWIKSHKDFYLYQVVILV